MTQAQDPTLRAIDALLQDFSAARIAEHLQNIYKDHLTTADGYDPEQLAEEYETITRITAALQERERITETARIRREAYEAANARG